MRCALVMLVLLAACGGPQRPSEHEGVVEPEGEGEPEVEPEVEVEVDAGIPELDTGTVAMESADTGPEPMDADAAPEEPVDAGTADPAQTALIARGRRVYDRVCETCHEDGPRIVGRHLPSARIRHQVRQGGRRMRAIPPTRLSDEDLDTVVAFLSAR